MMLEFSGFHKIVLRRYGGILSMKTRLISSDIIKNRTSSDRVIHEVHTHTLSTALFQGLPG